jgi:hypothetical protein
MVSAVDFLPSYMTDVHELAEMISPNFGSGEDFALLGAMATTTFASIPYFGRFAPYFERLCLRSLTTLRIEHAAQDVVAHAGKVLHATAADQHHGVLLEVMTFTRNVADDFAPLVRRTLATLRSAEFGFFGVVV